MTGYGDGMPLALLILGFGLVVVGLLFAFGAPGAAKAGGNALKSVSLEGPSWLILVGIGAGIIVYGSWLQQQTDAEKGKEADVVVTQPTAPPDDAVDEFFPNGFTFGDDNELDRLWRACDRGVWTSCDDLFMQADPGSEYEYFGATCGGVFTDYDLWCDQQRNIDEGLVP